MRLRTLMTGLIAAALPLSMVPSAGLAAPAPSPFSIEPYGGRWLGDGGHPLSATLNFQAFVHVDPWTGRLYIGDSHNGRLRIEEPGADGVVNGSADETIDTLVPTQVYGITSDSSGNVYLANAPFFDFSPTQVLRVAPDGSEEVVAGGGSIEPGRRNIPATEAAISPLTVDYDDARGILYITEPFAQRVLRVHNGMLRILAGVKGEPGFSGDGLPADSSEVRLKEPDDVTHDDDGNVYIADSLNGRVRKIDGETGVISTVAAIPSLHQDSINFGCTQFGGLPRNWLQGVEIDQETGELFVSTPCVNRVWRVDAAGHPTPFVGDGVLAQPPGSSVDGSPALQYRLGWPGSLALGVDGDLLVRTDFQVTVVHRTGPDTGTAERVIGTPYGEGVSATQGMLNLPIDLAMDDEGNAFVVDLYSATIRRIDAATGEIRTVAGSLVGEFASVNGHPLTEALFDVPVAIAVGGDGSLIVAEAGGPVRRVFAGDDGLWNGDPSESVITIAGQASDGPGGSIPVPDGTRASEAQFSRNLQNVIEGPDGSVYLSDSDASAVYRISPGPDGIVSGGGGEFVTRVAGSLARAHHEVVGGAYGCGRENVRPLRSPLGFPTGLEFDGAGNLAIAEEDCGRVRVVSPGPDGTVNGDGAETISTITGPKGAGSPQLPPFEWGLHVDGPAPDARYFFPHGLAFAPDGRLFIAEPGNMLIRMVTPGADGIVDGDRRDRVSTIAGNGVATGVVDGQGGDPVDDFVPNAPDARAVSLNVPVGIAICASSVCFVDLGDLVVRRISPGSGSVNDVTQAWVGGHSSLLWPRVRLGIHLYGRRSGESAFAKRPSTYTNLA